MTEVEKVCRTVTLTFFFVFSRACLVPFLKISSLTTMAEDTTVIPKVEDLDLNVADEDVDVEATTQGNGEVKLTVRFVGKSLLISCRVNCSTNEY